VPPRHGNATGPRIKNPRVRSHLKWRVPSGPRWRCRVLGSHTDTCRIDNGLRDAVNAQVGFDVRIVQSHRTKGSEAQIRGRQAEGLTLVSCLDEHAPIGSCRRVLPEVPREDGGEKDEGRGTFVPELPRKVALYAYAPTVRRDELDLYPRPGRFGAFGRPVSQQAALSFGRAPSLAEITPGSLR